MSLKITASIAAVFSLIYAVLNVIRFVQFVSTGGSVFGFFSLPSLAAALASLTLAVFLFHLVSKQKRS
jgi:hypothetical protein